MLEEWLLAMEKNIASLPYSVFYPELLLQQANYDVYKKLWEQAQQKIQQMTALYTDGKVANIAIFAHAVLLGIKIDIALHQPVEVQNKITILHNLSEQEQNPHLRRQILEEILANKNCLLQFNIINLDQCIDLYDELLQLVKNIYSEESDRRTRSLQIIHEVEKHKQEAENERRERERVATLLEQKRKELLSSALAVIRKNELLDTIRKRILEVFGSGEQLRRQLTEVAGTITSALNADQEWQVFETQFKALNGEFMEVIERRYPSLSQQEIKIAALLRTGLSTKDIAKLFLLEIRTVENHRTNIRRKLALQKHDDLIAFLKLV